MSRVERFRPLIYKVPEGTISLYVQGGEVSIRYLEERCLSKSSVERFRSNMVPRGTMSLFFQVPYLMKYLEGRYLNKSRVMRFRSRI